MRVSSTLLQVHVITGKRQKQQHAVREAVTGNAAKKRVSRKQVTYSVVSGPGVRSKSAVKTLADLNQHCRFSGLEKKVLAYLTDHKCRRTGKHMTRAQWKREGVGMWACSEEVPCISTHRSDPYLIACVS